MKQIVCREHGGTFTIESRRGRPPVRCSEENPCTHGPGTTRVERTASVIKNKRLDEVWTKAQRDAEALKAAARTAIAAARVVDTEPVEAPEPAAKTRTRPDPSLATAKAAKELLEAQGWTATGRAWTTDPRESVVIGSRTLSGGRFRLVEITAARGEELLTLIWQDGELIQQTYSLWDATKPSANGKPKGKLPFDPEELSDRELVQKLSGMPVTWWNRIGKMEESGIIPDKVTITHVYNGVGDEVPGDRVITFVDHSGAGFRTFRAGALLKVG